MRSFFGILLVAVLAVFTGVVGYYGTVGYSFVGGGGDGLSHTCQMLQLAETKQILTREQRAAIANRMMGPTNAAADDGSAEIERIFTDYMKGDCSNSVWSEFIKGVTAQAVQAGFGSGRGNLSRE